MLQKISVTSGSEDSLLTGAQKINAIVDQVGVMDIARTDNIRSAIHSGLSKLSAIETNRTSAPNTIKLTEDSIVFINGYQVKIPAGTVITLPNGPFAGVRDDLVFLEGWIDPALPEGQLNWRIRTVAGMDFGKYPEGLGIDVVTGKAPIPAQGGAASPLDTTSIPAIRGFYSSANRNTTGIAGKKVFLDDVGLYVAGDGTQASKDTLKTADGYVYAIPLFKVRRRNSGGFRKDNPNGARDFKTVTFPASPTITSSTTGQKVLSAVDYDYVQVGDLYTADGTLINNYQLQVLSKDGSSTVTVKALKNDIGAIVGTPVTSVNNNRPDGLFSNIIDATDLEGGDLRHKVSLTGYNYDQLLQESQDKLMRGELRTNKPTTLTKDQWGLLPAPKLLKQELVAKPIKLIDGTTKTLTNLASVGQFLNGLKDWSAGTPTNGWNRVSATTINNYYKSYKTSKVRLEAGKTYLIKTLMKSDFNNSGSNNNELGVMLPVTALSNYPGFVGAPNGVYTALYDKAKLNQIQSIGATFTPTITDDYFVGIQAQLLNAGTYYEFTNFMIIDITGIDITGKTLTDLDAMYPYIDSYPNFVENLIGSTSTLKPNGTTPPPLNITGEYAFSFVPTANWQGAVTPNIPVKPNTQYTLNFEEISGSGAKVELHYLDSAGVDVGTYLSLYAGTNVSATFTPPANCVNIIISMANNLTGATITYRNWTLVEGGTKAVALVPFGRWYTPDDFFNGFATTKLEGFNGHHFTLSDALTTVPTSDFIEAVGTPQKHVAVTQATAGQWSANDTVKVKSAYGVVHGLVDTDTGFAKLVKDGDGTGTIYVDDASKFIVGDSIKVISPTLAIGGDYQITAVDTTNKTITHNGATSSVYTAGSFVIETTLTSSSPAVTAAGIAGTWSGLGTKEATYTITTPPTDNKATLKMDYATTYPAGKGMANVPSDVLEAEVNGQRLVKGTTVSVKGNYEGKVQGNTDLVPHTFKGNAISTTLVAPSGTWAERDSVQYGQIYSLDGVTHSVGTSVNGNYAQQLFSFDLIRLIEDKYGEIPALDVAAKVQWLKDNLNKITANWHGYGSSVGGNKASFRIWDMVTVNWGGSFEHTSGSVSKLSYAVTDMTRYIDNNGFTNVLSYAPASDGVTASTIYTDYCEIEIELKTAETGYTVLQPEETKPKLSENLLTQNQAFPVDISSFNSYGGTTLSIDSLGVSKAVATVAGVCGVSIPVSIKGNKTYTYSAKVKVAKDKQFRLMRYNGTTSPASQTFVGTGDFQKVSWTFTDTADVTLLYIYFTSAVVGDEMLFAELKVQDGTVTNPIWTEGRKKKLLFNTLGKVKGSTIEVPHRIFTFGQAKDGGGNFPTPTTLLAKPEASQIHYDSVAKDDASVDVISTNIVGEYACQLIEYDFYQLGMSFAEIKKALRKLTVNWIGFGEGDNAGVVTNGATVKCWDTTGAGSWTDMVFGTASTPETKSAISTNSARITKDQKVYLLIHSTNASGAVNPAKLTAGYAKLDTDLADYVDYIKHNIVKVRPETKEVKLMFPARVNRIVGQGNAFDQVAVTYRYVPFQGENAGTIDGILQTPDYVFLASEGTAKAKTYGVSAYDKYKNIIAKVVNDFKPSDFEGQRLTLETPENLNNATPSTIKVPILSATGGGSAGYTDEKAGLLGGNTIGYIIDKSGLESKGRYLAFIVYLVVVKGEVMLAIKRRSSTSIFECGVVTSIPLLFKLDGRPLTKGA